MKRGEKCIVEAVAVVDEGASAVVGRKTRMLKEDAHGTLKWQQLAEVVQSILHISRSIQSKMYVLDSSSYVTYEMAMIILLVDGGERGAPILAARLGDTIKPTACA